MINFKQINTGKVELVIVKVPKGAHSFHVFPIACLICFSNADGSSDFIELEYFKYKVIGLSTELTEEQCRGIVQKMTITGNLLKHYTDEKLWCLSAKTSFASLMQANECFTENPYERPDIQYYMSDSAFTMREFREQENRWRKAEANTGSWLILRKL